MRADQSEKPKDPDAKVFKIGCHYRSKKLKEQIIKIYSNDIRALSLKIMNYEKAI